jgi:hypothetical protein
MRAGSEHPAASVSATQSIGGHPRALLIAIEVILTAACASDAVPPGDAQPEIGFAVSYTAGTRDRSGAFMGGTEMRHLTAYRGKLYAGNGYWEDRPGPEGTQSAQVLVLDRPGARWRVEHSFDQPLPEGWPGRQLGAGAAIGLALAPIVKPRRDFAISALAEVTFTTDAAGQALPQPVSMLLAASWDVTGAVEVFGRDDATGTWTAMALGQDRPAPDFLPMVRSLGVHRDRATGVDLVFAGADPRGIFSGVYDAGAPGRIRWTSAPELDITTIDAASFPGLGGRLRVMSFAECDGLLYATVGQQIFVRSDGAQASWRSIYTNPFPGHSESGLRGLTAITAPDGRGQVLLAAEEGHAGRIIRIDPHDGYKETTDLDLRGFLAEAWGNPGRLHHCRLQRHDQGARWARRRSGPHRLRGVHSADGAVARGARDRQRAGGWRLVSPAASRGSLRFALYRHGSS